ncbi:MAG: pyridoxal phosphate-dependent aminotransferase [Pseudomonadota bacterium]
MHFATTRLAAVNASASATISAHAKSLAAGGVDVIDLGLGEPDFDTPPHIVESAHVAATAGDTRYPPTGGTAALKSAVARKFERDNHLTFEPHELIVSNGAKQVIFAALMATLEPGDEVLLTAPYFDSYASMIRVIGGTPVVMPTRPADGFRLDPAVLAAHITPRTRWLLLNSPSNPAGAVYEAVHYNALAEVVIEHPALLVMSDEIYEHILFDDLPYTSILQACPDLRPRTLTVNGVSKAYAMTGWRIGYGAAPTGLIDAMVTVQSQISSGACAIAQAAAAAALNGPQDAVQQFRAAFERRRNGVCDAVHGISGLSLVKPAGAFYALINVEALLGGRFADDVAFTQWLLDDVGIATVPGSAYGTPGHFRISTACADNTLANALKRIADALSAL